MSKFFKDLQTVSQGAQRQPSDQDLNIRQMIEDLKQVSSSGKEVAEVRLNQSRKVQLGDACEAPLLLTQGYSAQIVLEAYRALRTRLIRVQMKSGLRSIAITSSSSGEGKTVTVVNLGLCYSQLSDQPVVVIDADLRTRGLTNLLGHPATPGLAEVLAGQVTPSEAILATDHENLFALPAGSASWPSLELFSGSRWQELLGWCSETFKIVLVDTPPILPLANFQLIGAACDGIVMVVRAHRGQGEAAQKTARALDPKKLLGVVFNANDISSEKDSG